LKFLHASSKLKKHWEIVSNPLCTLSVGVSFVSFSNPNQLSEALLTMAGRI